MGKDKSALNITEEENLKDQFEFGLNEDKREEVEKDGHELPEDQATDVANDSEEDKDDTDNGDDDEGIISKTYLKP